MTANSRRTIADLAGKIALVTGGGAGIGRAIVEYFADCGATVFVADNDPDRLSEIEHRAREQHWNVHPVACDVRITSEVDALMREIGARCNGLDILVNNVGDILGIIKPLEEMSDEEIDAVYAVVLRQVLVCTRGAIPLIRKSGGGGSIISISSIEGYRGLPNLVPYAAFKLGIEGFTKSLALELGPAGIRVNAIAPETTETQQIRPSEWISPQHRDRVKDWIPLGRFGVPEDIAGCALFLASELSAWVTGTTLHCDGGALAAAGWVRTKDGKWTNTPLVEGSGIDL
jgi:NAD(P)-dependent dehydrogenase (short-subunit alcohol dehydrogenase family)